MSQVIGIGETVLDIIFKNDQPQAAVPGGSTFNSIISLGRAGLRCSIVTEAGDDHVGDITCRYLLDNGVSDRFVCRHKGVKSHLSLAFLNERNDACYQFYKDHAGVHIERQETDVTAQDVVLFGSFFAINPSIRPEVGAMLRDAHDRGAMLYYDVNFRKPHLGDLPEVYATILENMRLSTVVRGSTEDFSLLFGSANPLCENLAMEELLSEDSAVVEHAVDRLYERLIAPQCPVFICTSGGGAVYLRTPSLRAMFPVRKIETVSTVGAGDNFNAGIIFRLMQSASVSPAERIRTIPLEEWTELIAMGQRFSQDVCCQLGNSISPELASQLRS